MLYIEKENAILRRLHETNYEMFDGNKDDALNFLDEQLNRFPEYANTVISQQIRMPIVRARYEDDGATYREVVQEMDRNRRSAHEAAIASVTILNRLSVRLDLPVFTKVDPKNRNAVADFVGDYIGDLYKTGTKGFDAATYNKTSTYDTKKLQERRAQIVRNMSAETGTELNDPEPEF